MTSDLRIISSTTVAASSRLSLTSTVLLLLKSGRKKNKSRIINNKKKKRIMENKISMAMSLNELPFIFDRERTTKILNENQIFLKEFVSNHYLEFYFSPIEEIKFSIEIKIPISFKSFTNASRHSKRSIPQYFKAFSFIVASGFITIIRSK